MQQKGTLDTKTCIQVLTHSLPINRSQVKPQQMLPLSTLKNWSPRWSDGRHVSGFWVLYTVLPIVAFLGTSRRDLGREVATEDPEGPTHSFPDPLRPSPEQMLALPAKIRCKPIIYLMSLRTGRPGLHLTGSCVSLDHHHLGLEHFTRSIKCFAIIRP